MPLIRALLIGVGRIRNTVLLSGVLLYLSPAVHLPGIPAAALSRHSREADLAFIRIFLPIPAPAIFLLPDGLAYLPWEWRGDANLWMTAMFPARQRRQSAGQFQRHLIEV
jgi:hypothetical protein